MSLFLCSNCCCGYPYPESALVELEVLAGDDVYFAYEIGTYYPDGVKQNTLQKFAVVSVLYTAPQITGVYQLVPLQDIQNPSTRAVYGRALGFVSGENNLSLSLSTNSQGSGIVGAFPDNTVFRFFLGMDPLVRSVITYGANAEPVSLEQLKSRQFTQNFPFSGQNQSQPYNYPFTIFDESLIEGFVPRGNTRHQPFTQVLEECISSQSTLSRKILFQVGVLIIMTIKEKQAESPFDKAVKRLLRLVEKEMNCKKTGRCYMNDILKMSDVFYDLGHDAGVEAEAKIKRNTKQFCSKCRKLLLKNE